MIPGGYILQPRSFDQSETAHASPVTREVWFYILRNVNHSDNGKFKRGQGFFQLGDIQEALSWWVGNRKEKYSIPNISKALRRLREGKAMETAKATRGVYVTVLNYNYFQDPKNYEGNGEGIPKGERRESTGNTINKNVKKKNKEEPKTPSGFDVFWNAYPKKVGKGAAVKAWKKIKPTLETTLTALEWQSRSEQWTKDGGQYIPNPTTYLNQQRWEDEPQAAKESSIDRMIREAEEQEAGNGLLRIT